MKEKSAFQRRLKEQVRSFKKTFRRNWALFRASKVGIAGLFLILIFVVMALITPFLGLRDPMNWRAPDCDVFVPDVGYYNDEVGEVRAPVAVHYRSGTAQAEYVLVASYSSTKPDFAEKLYAIDPMDGTIKFSSSRLGKIVSRPAGSWLLDEARGHTNEPKVLGDNDYIFVGTTDGKFYKISSTLQTLNFTYLGGAITVSAGVGRNIVLVATDNNTNSVLYAFNITGKFSSSLKPVMPKGAEDNVTEDIENVEHAGDSRYYNVTSASSNNIMHFKNWLNKTALKGIISKAVLYVTYCTSPGYDGTENISVAIRDSKFINTTIRPKNTTSIVTESFELHQLWKDLTVVELKKIELRFHNNARNRTGLKNVSFDKIWITATATDDSNLELLWKNSTLGSIKSAPTVFRCFPLNISYDPVTKKTEYIATDVAFVCADGKLFAFYLSNGTMAWPRAAELTDENDRYLTSASPAISWKFQQAHNEIGGIEGNIKNAVLFAVSEKGNIYRLSAVFGTKTYLNETQKDRYWLFPTTGGELSTPVVDDANNLVFVATSKGEVYAVRIGPELAATGLWLSPYKMGAPAIGEPRVGSNFAASNLIVASQDGTVYALREDRTLAWSASITDRAGNLMLPALFCGAHDIYWVALAMKDKVLLITATGIYKAPLPPTWVVQHFGYERQSHNTKIQYGMPESGNYYLLGTDNQGRDVLAQIFWGSRIALLVGFATALIAITIGVIVGLVSGYFGGKIDIVLMRFVDVMLVLPFLPFIITLTAVLGPSIFNIILAMSLLGWAGVARIIRAEVLSLKERPYVDSARVTGASPLRIMFRHIMPNIMPLAFLFMTFSVSGAILSEASLSFIGLGDPTTISWGQILYYVQTTTGALAYWWWLLPPGICITLICLGFFLMARAFDEIVNPRLRKRQ